MNLTYPEIFKQRGKQYNDAMLRFPQARRAEFAQLFAANSVAPHQRVLDMPAGGGYLASFLPSDVDLVSLELTPGFGAGASVHDSSQPWPWGSFHHVVCLAALHHIEDQPGFIRGLLDRLQPGGTLHLADVPAGSSLVRFLDDFVGRFNITGHQGSYLPDRAEFFSALGDVRRIGELDCPWLFANQADMLEFCAQLFGLVDCPQAELLQALHDDVGIKRNGAGLQLNWRLLYVDIQPKKNRP